MLIFIQYKDSSPQFTYKFTYKTTQIKMISLPKVKVYFWKYIFFNSRRFKRNASRMNDKVKNKTFVLFLVSNWRIILINFKVLIFNVYFNSYSLFKAKFTVARTVRAEANLPLNLISNHIENHTLNISIFLFFLISHSCSTTFPCLHIWNGTRFRNNCIECNNLNSFVLHYV